MNLVITKVTQNDICSLSIMTGELLYEIMDKIEVEVFNFNQRETEKRVVDLLNRRLYFIWVAKIDHKVVGFISMYESYSLYAEGAYGTIPELYVRKEYRSLGIGAMLLEQAKEFASLKSWKRLEVTTPPLPQFNKTLAFYETNNFEITGGRKLKIDVRAYNEI